MSTFTPTIDLELQDIGENVDTWGIPLNENFSKIDTAFENVLTFLNSGVGVVAQVSAVLLDNSVPINAAINAVAAAGGGRVIIPVGTFVIKNPIVLKSNVTIVGQGIGATVIFVDDSSGGTDYISNSPGGNVWPPLTNVTLTNFTICGRGETVHTSGGQVIRIRYCENVRIIGIESRYSRNFGMVVTDSDQVTVAHCKVYRTNGDGIAVWSSTNVVIQGNILIDINDDCISCHSDNTNTTTHQNEGISIVGNVVEGSQGIKVLGGKHVVVANNVLRRMLSYGIVIWGEYGAAPVQGTTPQLSITVEGNVISDVIFRPEPNPLNLLCRYIWIGGAKRQKGSAVSVPGWPTGTGGAITPFYVNPSYGPNPKWGIQYINNPNTTTNYPSPGPSWIQVRGNTCVRTLPACTNYSDWGYGPLWVGKSGNAAGTYDGAVAESNFAGVGLMIYPSLNRCIIEGNIFDGTFTDAVQLADPSTNTVWADFDIWRLVIRNNKFVGYTQYGIGGPGRSIIGKSLDMLIEGNEFDADPMFLSTNRGPNGTWVNSAAPNNLPCGISVEDAVPSLTVSRNIFRNMCQPIAGGGVLPGQSRDNIVVGNFISVGFSTSNSGVGVGYAATPSMRTVFEDSNPNSITFGKRLSVSALSASAMPTTGYWMRGDFVTNRAPLTVAAGKVLVGWLRLTVGNTNVADTDWVPVYDVTA